MRIYTKDVESRGYSELPPCGKKYIYVKATTTLDVKKFAVTRVMDAVIAQGELLKANIARMRQAQPGSVTNQVQASRDGNHSPESRLLANIAALRAATTRKY